MKPSASVLFTACAGIAVLVAIIAGFMMIGSPEEVRLRRLDEQRVRDLRSLSTALSDYRRKNDRLPETLDQLVEDLKRQGGWVEHLRLEDAVSGVPYDYRLKDGSSYELCARFDRVSEQKAVGMPTVWGHGQGRHCFSLEAAPRLRSEPSPPR